MLYKKEIKNALMYAEYDKIIEIYKNIGMKELENVLYEIAYYDEDISVYSFIMYMAEYDKKNRQNWIRTAASIINGAFCWINGAASIAFYHAKQLLKEEYSVENLLTLTIFNGMPDLLLSDEECIEIAKQILILDPNNIKAKEILKDLNLK